MLKRLLLNSFKRISAAEINLDKINVLIGSNNSGKSSVLQGIHFSTTVAAVSRQQGQATFSNEYLLYNPTFDFTMLKNDSPYANFKNAQNRSRIVFFDDYQTEDGNIEEVSYTIDIYKGRNHGNISCDRSGNYLRLGSLVTDPINLFSIYVPGLAGVPQSEELRAKAIIRKGVKKGSDL